VFGWLSWPAKKFKGKNFQVLFWTINPRREWVLVGAYLAACKKQQVPPLRFSSPSGMRSSGRDDNP